MISEAAVPPVLFGASVTGPGHLSQGRPNQDAWLKAKSSFGALAVVCDGLGSRAASTHGAQRACRAVRRAAAQWPGIAAGSDPEDLIRLIEVLWRLSLPPLVAADCATTCQFVLRQPDGNLILAGLGDGVLLVRHTMAGVRSYGGRSAGAFANETVGLGVPHRLRDWWIETLPPQSGRTVVIASDGVADDLRTDRLDAFVGWLTEDVAPLPAHRRWLRLSAELRRWPVPHHTDDKTLVVMLEKEQDQP
ncbi:MAG: protein phosphatase 2C domain-containing protein [Chromatiaceae bacterium]|nr:protein phosphatase 2C domain-containing protein [Chromatiaceae bacterium]MBP6733164.1 protein phosphatase 2C domain-containing protein [Chromatiaceae bacterium]MBP8284670.1 protein phosphatase 2C domain-containing protein [Chromatiaceae bacterium]MBP8288292.1 protein phosphatase 2C domain-containing protein [Chromatiaceae bacterium]MBP9602541.1 protein phosphatase 2C domain-containing protein [Chromatiaceae bacterium]